MTHGPRRPWRSLWRLVLSRRFRAWGALVVAALFAVLSLLSYMDAKALHDRGVRTEATIVEVKNPDENRSVDVRFTTAKGTEVIANISQFTWDPEPRVGTRAAVLYDPDSPDNLVDARKGPDYLTPSWGAVTALVAGLCALLLFTQPFRRRRARR